LTILSFLLVSAGSAP